MAIDLANDWLRKDIATPSVYYGYSQNVGSLDTDSTWAIRKVTTSGSTDTVTWNDNLQFRFNAKWSERVACFATPSGPLGVTWSVTTSQNSFSVTYSDIRATWTDLSGANLYRILLTDHLGETYNYLGTTTRNPYQTVQLTNEQQGNSYYFRGQSSYTYSLTVTAVNALGISASTVTIRT
jgi:hypothetical protein